MKRMPSCPKVPGAESATGDSATAFGRRYRGDSRWAGVCRSPPCFCVRWRLQIAAMAALVALPPWRRCFTSNIHAQFVYKQYRNQVIFHVTPLTPP